MIQDSKLQQLIQWFPHKGQKEVLLCQNREVIICAGRRWGKSKVSGYIVVKSFLQALADVKAGKRTSYKIWIVAPTYELTKKVFEYVTTFILAFDKSFGQFISGGEGRPYQLKMSENVWIQCKSTTEPIGLLGEELDLIIIDEAAKIPQRIYNEYIYPTTLAKSRECKVYIISTPHGKNWFSDLFRMLAEKGSAFHYTTLDGVETDPIQLEEIKKRTPELLFRELYMAEFVDEAGTVFRNLDRTIVPYKEQGALRGHWYVMGVDLGTVNDYTVLTVIDRETNEIVHVDRFKGIDYPTQKDMIRLRAWNYNNARVIIDATGVGKPIYEDLRQAGVFVEDFTFSGKTKEELVGKLIVFIDEMYLRIPNIGWLIDELKAFEYKYINDKTGEPLKNIQYGAPQGYHDDGVVSLGLAIWGLKSESPKAQDPISKELAKFKKVRAKSYI
jgi:hypothetical protein